jgi:hypothetical protein
MMNRAPRPIKILAAFALFFGTFFVVSIILNLLGITMGVGVDDQFATIATLVSLVIALLVTSHESKKWNINR